jgi:hypothetical protein
MIKFYNNDLELYKPDKNSYLESLEIAKEIKNTTNEKINFNCFWRVPKDFGRKQLAVIKSILVNHNINDIQINLYSNVDLSNNIHLKGVLPYINLKIWDPVKESKDTILENDATLDGLYDSRCWIEGDLFRLLILHNYGGFYLDMDLLVLRDLSPLNNLEFLYQWGTSGFSEFEPKITMNGAIMRLNKRSDLSKEFLLRVKQTPPYKDSTCWGNTLYSKITDNDLLVLPGIWFNSEWGFEGTENDPFKRKEKIELFDGAFTWHWHNKWDDSVEEGCKFEVLEKLHDNKFKELYS